MAAVALKLTFALVACMVIAAPYAEAAITCGQVTGGLAPCLGYLRSPGTGPVPPGCCNGIKSLIQNARTTQDRQAGCACLKRSAGSIPGINFKSASGLPGKCGVNIGYPISLSVDCSKVK